MRASQLRTMLWLRWRLTRNQWARSGRLSVGISFAVSAILLLLSVGGGLGGLLAGVFGAAQFPPMAILVIYDALTVAFLFFWMIGVFATIQRSESIDIGRLLHLPISLKGVFLLNYAVSHVTPSIIAFAPLMLGLASGLTLGRDWKMIAMVPLILGIVFMVTAWTYHLRGWLVILMKNPRRYRAVVAGVTMAFVLLAQLPNLLNLRFLNGSRSLQEHRQSQAKSGDDTGQSQGSAEHRGSSDLSSGALLVHVLVPPLWVGYGAMSLAQGEPLPGVLAAAAAFGIGGLGLSRAYRSTRRFYEGQTAAKKKSRAARKERKARSAGGGLLEKSIPGLPEEATAVALATLRSLMRAAEVKMALFSNAIMLIAFGTMALLSHPRNLSFQAQLLYGTGVALLPFLGMIHVMTNQFGLDREAFRTLVLSPAPRSQILLGKNLAMLPISVTVELVYLILAAFALHLEASVVLAAFAQSLAAFFLICIPGNAVSSLLPYRIREGTMAATKIGGARALLNILAHLICTSFLSVLLVPALAAFLLRGASGPTARLVYVALSVVELATVVTIYGLSLFGLGELLQRREKEILRMVTQERE